jgi:hypothetical protein
MREAVRGRGWRAAAAGVAVLLAGGCALAPEPWRQRWERERQLREEVGEAVRALEALPACDAATVAASGRPDALPAVRRGPASFRGALRWRPGSMTTAYCVDRTGCCNAMGIQWLLGGASDEDALWLLQARHVPGALPDGPRPLPEGVAVCNEQPLRARLPVREVVVSGVWFIPFGEPAPGQPPFPPHLVVRRVCAVE